MGFFGGWDEAMGKKTQKKKHGISWDVLAYPNVPFIYSTLYNLYIIVINYIIIYIYIRNLLIFAEVCPIHIWEHLALTMSIDDIAGRPRASGEWRGTLS